MFLQYAMILWPHSNRRYFESIRTLAGCELEIIAQGFREPVERHETQNLGRAVALMFDHPGLSDRELGMLLCHSSLYLLLQRRPDGGYDPISDTNAGVLPEDLAGVPKYKGKTNEVFTDLLINAALFSSECADAFDAPLTILDPVCGRGTTLFRAATRGYHSVGIEWDQKELTQAAQYFQRYLEYHRIKHKQERDSLTLRGKTAGQRTRFTFAATAERYKAGDTRSLSLIRGDAKDAAGLLRAGTVDVVAGDLPYGVQHEASGDKSKAAQTLLDGAVAGWGTVLRAGGAMALSFNGYTLKREHVWAAMEKAGLTPLTQGPYARMEHWVEQAIRRDVAVARKS